jgi:hypothetical protein
VDDAVMHEQDCVGTGAAFFVVDLRIPDLQQRAGRWRTGLRREWHCDRRANEQCVSNAFYVAHVERLHEELRNLAFRSSSLAFLSGDSLENGRIARGNVTRPSRGEVGL